MKYLYITAGPGTIFLGKEGEVGTKEQPMLKVDPPFNNVMAHPKRFRLVLLTPKRYEAVKRLVDEQIAEYISSPISQEGMIEV